jgi:DNA modification methylase
MVRPCAWRFARKSLYVSNLSIWSHLGQREEIMSGLDSIITDQYAIYQNDCVRVMSQLPSSSIDLSVYSPPFGGLYNYSSANEDLSNSLSYEQFFEHYDFVVKEIARLTKPGRMTAVHAMDVPTKSGGLRDFPGDIIRQHERLGFKFWARYGIWKEPLRVAIRTRSRGLTHRQIVKDSSYVNNAGADWLLVFKRDGENKTPIEHPLGLDRYCGEREVPEDLLRFKGHTDPKTNKLAHWIWQQYASSYWDDVRVGRVLPYLAARDSDEEKHVHPLQLDVIERVVQLWSNPGETVLTPFMGVGSEVWGAVANGRRGIGMELKASYFRQAARNLANVQAVETEQTGFFDDFATANEGEAEYESV